MSAQIVIDGPTTDWTAVLPRNGNQSDYFADRQGGGGDVEIVGNADNPGFYVQFYDGGTDSGVDATDGQLAFRLRMSGDANPAGFNRYALVGMDLFGNGTIDLFVVQSQEDDVSVWFSGTDLNNSPSTTDIVSEEITRPSTGTNFNWTTVTSGASGNDPSATSTDIDSATGTDYFLSFLIDFGDIVSAANARGLPFDDTDSIAYIVATATQDNSLNSDLNGIDGALSQAQRNLTWQELGVISESLNMDGSFASAAIPEPSSFMLAAGGAVFLLAGIRRRRVR